MELCSQTDGCQIFTFDSRSGNCFRLTLDALRHEKWVANIPQSSGIISGELRCFKTQNSEAFGSNTCYQTGKTYLLRKEPYLSLAIKNTIDCRYACADRKECSYFTHQYDKCHLWRRGMQPILDQVDYITPTETHNLPVSGDQKCFGGKHFIENL